MTRREYDVAIDLPDEQRVCRSVRDTPPVGHGHACGQASFKLDLDMVLADMAQYAPVVRIHQRHHASRHQTLSHSLKCLNDL